MTSDTERSAVSNDGDHAEESALLPMTTIRRLNNHKKQSDEACAPSGCHVSLQIVFGLSNRSELTLRVLRRLAGSFESDLLALFDAGIPCQQSGLLDDRAQFLVETAKRAGDAMSGGFGLAGAATTNDADVHIKPLSGI